MRVPPEILGAKPKWQLPLVLLSLALTVIATGALSGVDTRAIATQSNRITKLQVVISRRAVELGSTLQAEDLGLEVRPIESLPEGVFTRLDEVVGKISGAPIPEGMPLAAWLLQSSDSDAAPEAVIAIETTRPEPVEGTRPEPVEGTRPELVEGPRPEPVEGTRVIAPPPVLPPLEVIPVEPVKVEAPPVRETMLVVPDTKLPALPPPHQETVQHTPPPGRDAPPKPARRKFSSYAWISGEPVTFGVSKSGKIQIVDEKGRTAPLDDYRGDEAEEE